MCFPNSFSDRILLSFASREHFSESTRTAKMVVFLLLVPVGAVKCGEVWVTMTSSSLGGSGTSRRQ